MAAQRQRTDLRTDNDPVVAADTGQPPVRIPRRSKPWRQIGQCVIFQYPESMIGQIGAHKRFGVSFQKIISYGATPQDAIQNWHQEKARRQANEQKIFTRQVAMTEYSFEEACIGRFCADNGLIPDSSYSRQELRAQIIRKRAMNVEVYRNQLARIGIHLGSTSPGDVSPGDT